MIKGLLPLENVFNIKKIYDDMPVMIHIINPKGEIVYVNKFWLNTMGYIYDEVIGDLALSFLTPESYRYATEHALPKLLKQGYVENINYHFIKSNGELININLNGLLTRIDDIDYGIAVCNDITEKTNLMTNLIESEARLVSLNAELREMMEVWRNTIDEKTELIYRISHDLRSPFCSIEGLLGLLKFEYSKKSIELIEDAIRKAKNTTSNLELLQANELVSGQTIKKETLKKVLHHELHFFKDKLTEKSIRVSIDFREPNIMVDSFRLGAIIYNIINNSIQFYDPKKSKHFLQIKSNVKNNILNLEFEDNGIGATEDILKNISLMFYRGNHRSSGVGLGLYIIKDMIKKLNGFANYESKYNEWFRIKISIPIS